MLEIAKVIGATVRSMFGMKSYTGMPSPPAAQPVAHAVPAQGTSARQTASAAAGRSSAPGTGTAAHSKLLSVALVALATAKMHKGRRLQHSSMSGQ